MRSALQCGISRSAFTVHAVDVQGNFYHFQRHLSFRIPHSAFRIPDSFSIKPLASQTCATVIAHVTELNTPTLQPSSTSPAPSLPRSLGQQPQIPLAPSEADAIEVLAIRDGIFPRCIQDFANLADRQPGPFRK